MDVTAFFNSPLFLGVASGAISAYVASAVLGNRVKDLEERLQDYDRGPNPVLSRLARLEPRGHK